MDKTITTKEPKLTLKQKRFLKLYLETGNGTKSALAVYNCKDYTTAQSIASENLSKLKNPIKAYMEANGLDLGRLMGVLDDGLKANRVISAIKTDKEATGATADFIDVPDHAVRHKYLETASKWLGVETSQPTNQVNIQVNANKFFGDDK